MSDYLTLEDIEWVRQMPMSWPDHTLSAEEWWELVQNPQPSLTYPPHETKRYDRTNKTRRKGRGKRK